MLQKLPSASAIAMTPAINVALSVAKTVPPMLASELTRPHSAPLIFASVRGSCTKSASPIAVNMTLHDSASPKINAKTATKPLRATHPSFCLQRAIEMPQDNTGWVC